MKTNFSQWMLLKALPRASFFWGWAWSLRPRQKFRWAPGKYMHGANGLASTFYNKEMLWICEMSIYEVEHKVTDGEPRLSKRLHEKLMERSLSITGPGRRSCLLPGATLGGGGRVHAEKGAGPWDSWVECLHVLRLRPDWSIWTNKQKKAWFW